MYTYYYPDLKHKWGYRNHYHKKSTITYTSKKKQKYDQRLETVIYLCMQLKCGREKNSEANTLAMLFEAHRSLLIDIFLSQQKLPKMLIMAHMCTSLSIMRLKSCFFGLLSDSRSIEGSVENIKILILPQSVCMDSCNIYIDSSRCSRCGGRTKKKKGGKASIFCFNQYIWGYKHCICSYKSTMAC